MQEESALKLLLLRRLIEVSLQNAATRLPDYIRNKLAEVVGFVTRVTEVLLSNRVMDTDCSNSFLVSSFSVPQGMLQNRNSGRDHCLPKFVLIYFWLIIDA